MKVKDYLKMCLEFDDEYNTSTAIMAFCGSCVMDQTAEEFVNSKTPEDIMNTLAKIIAMLNDNIPDNMVQNLIKENVERSKE